MSGERRVWTDERIEQVMGIVLRVGVLLAAALVVVGGAVYLSRYGTGAPRPAAPPPGARSP
jgi:hypothetical protein